MADRARRGPRDPLTRPKHGPAPFLASGRLYREALDRAYLRDLAPRPRTPSSSIVLLQFCTTCREYMLEGSAALGRCVTCGEPQPSVAAQPG